VRRLEKTFQKDVLITEVFSARETAVRKLDMTVDAAFPDGKDAYHLTEMNCGSTHVEDLRRSRKKARTFRPETGAIRSCETINNNIQLFVNCIQKRLESSEIEEVVQSSASCLVLKNFKNLFVLLLYTYQILI